MTISEKIHKHPSVRPRMRQLVPACTADGAAEANRPAKRGRTGDAQRAKAACRRGQLSEHQAAHLWPGAVRARGGGRARRAKPAGRRPGRGTARRGADPVSRVLSRSVVLDHLQRLHRLSRAGAECEAVQPRADRADSHAGARRRLAHQRRAGASAAGRAARRAAAVGAVAAGGDAGRYAGRRGAVDWRPRDALARRSVRGGVGFGRRMVPLERAAIRVRHVGGAEWHGDRGTRNGAWAKRATRGWRT